MVETSALESLHVRPDLTGGGSTFCSFSARLRRISRSKESKFTPINAHLGLKVAILNSGLYSIFD